MRSNVNLAAVLLSENRQPPPQCSKKIGFIPPQANFVMIETGGDVREMQSLMLAKGVAIGTPFPPLDRMIRVSMGTDAEMMKFRNTLIELLAV